MNADNFTYAKEPYYQERIFNLVGYSHTEIKNKRVHEKFSRENLRKRHALFKGTPGSRSHLELEDFLRNDLVQNYLRIYKAKFNLQHFHFEPGVDEIRDGISIGSLDIKVIFPNKSLELGEEYLAIECKRINKLLAKKRYYIDDGLKRFITRHYYPESDNKVAWMLSFMECEKDTQRQSAEDIVSHFNELLRSAYRKHIIREIGEQPLDLSIDPTLEVFNSIIQRDDNTELVVYHIFLDYYDLIES